jgi:hypothetical protein
VSGDREGKVQLWLIENILQDSSCDSFAHHSKGNFGRTLRVEDLSDAEKVRAMTITDLTNVMIFVGHRVQSFVLSRV